MAKMVKIIWLEANTNQEHLENYQEKRPEEG
jgi:hypothetical protein